MKTLAIAVATLIFLAPISLYGEEAQKQAEKETEEKTQSAEKEDNGYKQDTFFGPLSDVETGGYAELITSFGKILDDDARLFGVRGGCVINHSLLIGGGGYNISNQVDIPDDSEDRNLSLNYGGLMVGYTFMSSRKIHLHTNLLGGWGSVTASKWDSDHDWGSDWNDDDDSDDEDNNDKKSESDSIVVLEPDLMVEMNINKWFRVGFGGSYRYVRGVTLLNIKNEDVSGANAVISFKFGKF